jgi:hypothetical protein
MTNLLLPITRTCRLPRPSAATPRLSSFLKAIRPVRYRSAKAARLFGLIMILMVSAWDMDAMRIHIAARSWYTLAFVALFLVVHVSDYLTVGRLVNRIDSFILATIDGAVPVHALREEEREDEVTYLPRYGWQRFFSLWQPQLSPIPRQATAKLYTFTAVTTTAAQVSGAPYPVAQQHFIVEAE